MGIIEQSLAFILAGGGMAPWAMAKAFVAQSPLLHMHSGPKITHKWLSIAFSGIIETRPVSNDQSR